MNIENILDLLRLKIEAINPLEPKFLRSNGSDNGFEELVPLIIEEIISELPSQNVLIFEVHYGHHFPDMDLTFNGIKYGLELKYRKNGSWSTNGNSVLETITGEDYEEIYLLFGSKISNENRLLIKYAPYWQTTSNIKVTHSPRFTINMNDSNESVFVTKEDYDLLRKMDESEKISFIQHYLKENSIGAKWYTSSNETVPPTQFNELTIEKKNQIKAELLILFPDDLLVGSSRTKYNRSAEYILDSYYIYNKSIRDLFSSGGVYLYAGLEFPKILGTLVSLQENLTSTLENASKDFFDLCIVTWSQNMPTHLVEDSLYESYKNILNYIGNQRPYKQLLGEINIANLSEIVF